jgi:subtilisin family serine protease
MKNFFGQIGLCRVSGRVLGLILWLWIIILILHLNISYAEGVGENHFNLLIDNRGMTLDARQADLSAILKDISIKTGIDIVIDPDVNSAVTASFSRVPLEEAINKIAGNNAVVFSKSETGDVFDIIRIRIFSDSKKMAVEETLIKTSESDIKRTEFQGRSNNADGKTHKKRVSKTAWVTDKTTGKVSQCVSDELVVRFSDKLNVNQIQQLIDNAGATIKTHIRQLDYYVLSVAPGMSVDETLAWVRGLQDEGIVVQAEPNYLIPIKIIPDDPDFLKQWSLSNTGQTGENDVNIRMVEAWDVEKGRPEVVIAVIDTGLDYTHEDLITNIWQNPGEIPDNGIDDDGNGYVDDVMGWDFVDSFGGAVGEDVDIPDNDPMDRHGHGTHVAGIIGAVTNNSKGIAGVCWHCRIMPVRAGYKTPSGDGVLESADAARAILYAADNGARVINLSWGDYQKSNLIEDAITYTADKDVLIVAAAGNENSTDPVYPSASGSSTVLAVGATDAQDRKSAFSNYGQWVDVSAPGANIYSTHLEGSYIQMSGTSMAAPHAAGLAGLLFSHFPGSSALQIKAKIMRSAHFIEELTGKNTVSGRIDAYAALTENYSTPHVFSLNPDAASEDGQITLFGDAFGAKTAHCAVTFHPGITANIVSWNDEVIICEIPEGARTGKIFVTTSEGTSNGINVDILEKFYIETLIENEFLNDGYARGWQADDQSWQYRLPFTFPFFGQEHDRVYVCSNGYLDFSSSACSYMNSDQAFKSRQMIAPAWDDLTTGGVTRRDADIFIHSPSKDSICFRWAAERYETGRFVNVEVVLSDNGNIQFNYGPGNTDLLPTIGISNGTGQGYQFAAHHTADTLEQVPSVLFSPVKHAFTIALEGGWNLISLPLVPDDNRVSQTMKAVNSGIDSVWGYQAGTWESHTSEFPEMSDLKKIRPGAGYWVKTSQPKVTIDVRGGLTPATPDWTDGWNLIGLTSLKPQPILQFLSGLDRPVTCIWGYQNGSWQVYDSRFPELSDLEILEPGRGYWMKVFVNP